MRRQAGQQELLGPYNNDDDYHIVVICYSSEWMNQLYMNTYRGREREIVDQNKIDSHRITTAMTSDQHHHHHQRAAANERKPELMPSTDWWWTASGIKKGCLCPLSSSIRMNIQLECTLCSSHLRVEIYSRLLLLSFFLSNRILEYKLLRWFDLFWLQILTTAHTHSFIGFSLTSLSHSMVWSSLVDVACRLINFWYPTLGIYSILYSV